MKKITFSDPHRRKHFDFFRKMDQPHFGVTVEVDITEFLAKVRHSAELRFTPAVVYLLTRTALAVTPFRWRLRGDEVVEHASLRPSFTVPTAASDVFSFCTVPYRADPREFHRDAVAEIQRRHTTPSLEDEAGTDDYLFLSTFPWASFTNVSHAMHYTPVDSVPRMVWGKYHKSEERTLLPLSLQAHHALVDGSDLGRFIREFEQNLRECHQIFKNFS